MENTSTENTSTLGSLGKKALAWIVLIAAALVAFKIIAGAVIGLVTMLFTIALVVAVVCAVVWALRRI